MWWSTRAHDLAAVGHGFHQYVNDRPIAQLIGLVPMAMRERHQVLEQQPALLAAEHATPTRYV